MIFSAAPIGVETIRLARDHGPWTKKLTGRPWTLRVESAAVPLAFLHQKSQLVAALTVSRSSAMRTSPPLAPDGPSKILTSCWMILAPRLPGELGGRPMKGPLLSPTSSKDARKCSFTT